MNNTQSKYQQRVNQETSRKYVLLANTLCDKLIETGLMDRREILDYMKEQGITLSRSKRTLPNAITMCEAARELYLTTTSAIKKVPKMKQPQPYKPEKSYEPGTLVTLVGEVGMVTEPGEEKNKIKIVTYNGLERECLINLKESPNGRRQSFERHGVSTALMPNIWSQ